MCGVSTIYKWIAERAAIEQHVKHGFGVKVRVVVKSYARKQKVVCATPSRYALRAPRKPIDEVRRVLEWLAGSPSGSVSLKELVNQFSIVPQFPDKSIQAQVAFVRRMVRAHALHGHVSFKIKRHTGNPTNSGSSPPVDPQEQSRYEMPSLSLAPPMHQAPARPLAPSDDNDDNLSDIGVDSVDLLDVLLQDYDCMSDSELSEAYAVPKCASEVDRLNNLFHTNGEESFEVVFIKVAQLCQGDPLGVEWSLAEPKTRVVTLQDDAEFEGLDGAKRPKLNGPGTYP
ncbi:hypothetical protein H257_14292 [Aphanomyces astaci]|uniref:Uncharacterized protein n=1 Tax=Aphanomyces astaci TaxID=112090 RepID=W4FRN9_APHAT|nr:hypothetical protein H257_14292 [Aphanomyces astaci]ETV70132.1 hypothetical protein H257_14292 [Aphanomyces astaci]|eukprot:XP_009840363.1 hypothetical protein H257_14292 [Aphanomyces astaci]